MTIKLTMAQLRLLKHIHKSGEQSLLALMNSGGFSVNTIESAKRAGLIFYDAMTKRHSLTEEGKHYV